MSLRNGNELGGPGYAEQREIDVFLADPRFWPAEQQGGRPDEA